MRHLISRTLLGCVAIALAALPFAMATALWHPARPLPSSSGALEGEVFLEDLLREPIPIRWVDARSLQAFEAGHVPGAFHLSPANWNEAAGPFFLSVEPGDRIVIYCADSNCGSSHEVARRLQSELGLENVAVLQGGWSAVQSFGPEKIAP